MPLKGLICRDCWKLTDVSGRHWMSECQEPTIHPGLVQAAVEEDAEHRSYPLTTLSPSKVLGKIRDEFIRRTMPYFPEAQGLTNLLVGKSVGEMLQRGLENVGWKGEYKAEGEIWGYPWVAFLDDVLRIDGEEGRPGWFFIENKFAGKGEFFYTRSGYEARPEASAQVCLGVHLLAQNEEGFDFDDEGRPKGLRAYVWTGTMPRAAIDYKTKQFVDSWIKQKVKPMSLEEIGALYPGGASNTVREAADTLHSAFARVEAGEDPKEVLKDIPPSCESMYGGACRPYCGSNRVCFRARGKPLREAGIIEVGIPWEECGL